MYPSSFCPNVASLIPRGLPPLPLQLQQSESLAATVEFISDSLKTSLMRPPSIRAKLCLVIRCLPRTPNGDGWPRSTYTQTPQAARWTAAFPPRPTPAHKMGAQQIGLLVHLPLNSQ